MPSKSALINIKFMLFLKQQHDAEVIFMCTAAEHYTSAQSLNLH